MATRDAPLTVLLLAIALAFAVAAAWLRPIEGLALAAPVLAVVAAALVWVATRPWHPVVAPLYRARLRAAWEAWTEALERWYARDDRKGAYEAQRATDDLVVRLESLRPPRAEAAAHAARLLAAARYAAALRAWHAAPDDAEAAARLQAAHDALATPDG